MIRRDRNQVIVLNPYFKQVNIFTPYIITEGVTLMSTLKNIFLGWILYVLIVPFVGANPVTEPTTTTVPATPATAVEQVDINTADAVDLQARLEGIGEKKAMAIIEFREKNGPFKVPADLMQVPGIGEKIFEKNKDRIIAVLPTNPVKEGATTENAAEATPPTVPSGTESLPPNEVATPPPQSEEATEETTKEESQ